MAFFPNNVQDVPSYNGKGMLVAAGDALAAAGVTIDEECILLRRSGERVGRRQADQSSARSACMRDVLQRGHVQGRRVGSKCTAEDLRRSRRIRAEAHEERWIAVRCGPRSNAGLAVLPVRGALLSVGRQVPFRRSEERYFDSDAAREALAQLHDLIWKCKVAPLNEEDFARDFMSQKVAIIFTDPWQA